ncbi:hypothetical protein [Actinoplanes sp. NPDC048796]|uniref:hypothetical protein n=1 Tax=Actinoplanes sp. NPDC048796 TaxID=3155640 RepID=UPI00340801AF
MDDYAAFRRLCRTVYVAARAGSVDCTDAFDLAAAALESTPGDAAATELASLSIDCAEASRPRMAELALAVLDAVDYEPGFAEEPAWLAGLQDAMRLVNQDVTATGLPHPCRLKVHPDQPDLTGNAYAASWDGHTGTAQGVFPRSGADPVSALVAVAEDTQDAIMHTIWAAWPVCPEHHLGVHAEDHHESAVWWCTGAGGHAVAPIGDWRARS